MPNPYPSAPSSKMAAAQKLMGGSSVPAPAPADEGAMEATAPFSVTASDYPELSGKKEGDVVSVPMRVVKVDGDNYEMEYAKEETTPAEGMPPAAAPAGPSL